MSTSIKSKTIYALLCASTVFAHAAASAGELTLFQDDNFRGRSVNVRSDVRDLSRLDFNDKTSSIVVRSGSWEVCKDAEFRNSCRVLQPGRYASMPGMNDSISSVREVRRGDNGRAVPSRAVLATAAAVPTTTAPCCCSRTPACAASRYASTMKSMT